ncbi:type II secretion system minor pseudopilin GspK [Salinimonas lutimaris]|uniref:type II secretion system minor pseudopilin GspK n=1 Tax=Salinimonas lutimaris TaxID=914153 RepID=UPI0022B69DBF|nr:type II secretion system minor pseudopilin GspK [Salinimonas lutimaris]
MRRHQQRGVALLIVLMIVALVSVLATEMGTRLQLQVQRVMNLKNNNQAYWYAIGAEAFARHSVQTLMEQTGERIALDQPWSQQFAYPVENGAIEAQLEDMQSCFNLNALVAEPQSGGGNQPNNNNQIASNNASGTSNNNNNTANAGRPRGPNNAGDNITDEMTAFMQMLTVAELQISSYEAETLRDSLADWLDEDSQMRPYGAEDADYEAKSPPYLAANRLMTSQSELRLVNGIKPQWMRKLLPLVCVIPEKDSLTINVNTLTEERAPVLAGLTGLDMAQARSLISGRPANGWETPADFLAEPVINALNLNDTQRSWFSVSTQYFILHTKAHYNNSSFTMTSVLSASSSAPAKVIRREFSGVD